MPEYEGIDGAGTTRTTLVLRFLVKYKLFIACGLAVTLLGTTLFYAIRPPTFVYIPLPPFTPPTFPPPTTQAPLCPQNLGPEELFNCHPEGGADEKKCLDRNCCWKNLTDVDPLAPSCYFPENFRGYAVSIVEESKYQMLVALDRNFKSGFPGDVQRVFLTIDHYNENLLRLKFFDPEIIRYEVPLPVPLNLKRSAGNQLYQVDVSDDGLLTVSRNSTGKELIKTDLRRLVFSEQFIQIDWDLPSNHIYGLSEHKDAFRQNVTWRKLTVFNRGEEPRDSVKVPSLNLYGTHPLYVMTEDAQANTHGVFLLNSNAMDIILQPKPAITWRTVGGILDFFVYLGPKPLDVVRQHANLIGTPAIPPYWTLGFHLSRYGYNSAEAAIEAWNRTVTAGIPLDCQWTDIDAMDLHNDFTYDKTNFAGLPDHVETLHQRSQKWIPILDPGVSNKEGPGYRPYDDGVALDIFVKDYKGNVLEGKVWNRDTTVFVDFTNPKSFVYWAKQTERFHDEIPFDALWIDMNEPYSFISGENMSCPMDDPLESPQYVPGDVPLNTHTLCMTAQQHLGKHYNVHSLYAHYETVATNYALKGILKKRPFVLSRANFAGHGHFGAHWTGDVDSSVDHMKWSIPSILTFNMYGVPMIGSDICGFQLNTSAALCARWSSLGAFYPFARNHNDHGTIDQDPAVLGPEVASAAKKALTLRYQLLPYLYTLLYEANVNGDPVIRPLYFEFLSDPTTVDIETQFMWGSGLMVLPVLEEDTTNLKAYFPAGKWYDVQTRALLIDSKGEWTNLTVPIDEIRVGLRQGNILPTQDPEQTTTESRTKPFRLVAALDNEGKACGTLFWDEGDSIDSVALGLCNLINFSIDNSTLTSTPVFTGYNSTMSLVEVQVLGVATLPGTVLVDGASVKSFKFKDSALTVTLKNLDLRSEITVSWK